jgi:GT2 family glycosyltransferase
MNNLAPIVLFVYNRPDHTQKTLQALQKNTLAFDSELFIYADAAKNNLVKQQVDEVRTLISNVSGFRNVTVIKQEINTGLANSIIGGVTEIANKYGKVIALEDDLLTSPYF